MSIIFVTELIDGDDSEWGVTYFDGVDGLSFWIVPGTIFNC